MTWNNRERATELFLGREQLIEPADDSVSCSLYKTGGRGPVTVGAAGEFPV